MPLKLIDPRPGKTPYYAIRGTYLGQYVDRSSGTSDRRIARKLLAKIEDEIERGAYATPGEDTFASAALRYMQAGGEKRFMAPILLHFGTKPIKAITQTDIDNAAIALYPTASPATRNRQLYSPAISVLRAGGAEKEFKRPAGARGQKRTSFLSADQAGALFSAAGEIDAEFRSFLIFLCYTGCRLTEACLLATSDLHLAEGWAFLRQTKNGEPRTVYLPAVVIAALANLSLDGKANVFRFRKNGRIYKLLDNVATKAKVNIPDRVAFHIFRHTYGAWMTRNGADLVSTGAWKSKQAASVYEHLDVSEEARKADLLPIPKGAIK